jgi:F-type H+-transporting ATPase subunit epsilon
MVKYNFFFLFIMSIQLCILRPDNIAYQGVAEELILPSRNGQIGVLSGHSSMITALDIGPIMFRTQSRWKAIALIGGFSVVKDNQVTILVNEAEICESIEVNEASALLKDATNRLNQAVEEKDKIEATLAFKRARARYQVVLQSNGSKSFLVFFLLCRNIVDHVSEWFDALEH